MVDEIAIYDFCIAWNWDGDRDLFSLASEACRKHNLTLLEIIPENFDTVLQLIGQKKIFFKTFFDRASDTDEKFSLLVQWAKENNVYFINSDELAKRASDKSIMHYELTNNGFNTPHTIILPSYNSLPELEKLDISTLGEKFIIKPSRGGGSEGVVLGADSWEKILSSRKDYPDDKYLLQATVVPKEIDSRAFWFRVIYCTETIYPFWWNRHTHVYSEVTSQEEEKYSLFALRNMVYTISKICKLELFSTEIALRDDNIFVVVDYVNDQIDLRLKSKNHESVPDGTVHNIVEQIVSLAIANK